MKLKKILFCCIALLCFSLVACKNEEVFVLLVENKTSSPIKIESMQPTPESSLPVTVQNSGSVSEFDFSTRDESRTIVFCYEGKSYEGTLPYIDQSVPKVRITFSENAGELQCLCTDETYFGINKDSVVSFKLLDSSCE